MTARAPRTFHSVAEVEAGIGLELGPTEWLRLSQGRVDQFADATGDHQWIHVDPERARLGPFGGTVAHGYLTLALIPHVGSQLFEMDFDGPRLNYGIDKVRFPKAVTVGSRVRGTCSIRSVESHPMGHKIAVGYVIEIEGEAKPACVAETITMVVVASASDRSVPSTKDST